MYQIGQEVKQKGLTYMFMGYIDYKRKRCMLADEHGNTHWCWVEEIYYF